MQSKGMDAPLKPADATKIQSDTLGMSERPSVGFYPMKRIIWFPLSRT